jgi:hypothetical protein
MVTSVKKDVNALNQIQIQKVFFILFCLYWIATLVAMAPMSVALVLLLVFVFFIQLKGRFSEFKNTWKLNLKLQRYAWITIVLTTVCVLSVLSSWYHWDSSQRLKDLLKLGKLWHFYVPLVLAWAWSQQTPLDRDRIWQVYFFLAAIISVLGVIEHFTGFLYPRPIHSNPGRFHTQVFFKFHLSYASIMIFPFFLLLDYPRMRTAVKIPILLIGFLGLVFTYSRTLWMALPVGLILWFWFE